MVEQKAVRVVVSSVVHAYDLEYFLSCLLFVPDTEGFQYCVNIILDYRSPDLGIVVQCSVFVEYDTFYVWTITFSHRQSVQSIQNLCYSL